EYVSGPRTTETVPFGHPFALASDGSTMLTTSPAFHSRSIRAILPAASFPPAGSSLTLIWARSHHAGMRRLSGNVTGFAGLMRKSIPVVIGYPVSSSIVPSTPPATFAVTVHGAYMYAARPSPAVAYHRCLAKYGQPSPPLCWQQRWPYGFIPHMS